MKAGRENLKSRWERLADIETDQKKGIPQPPVEKEQSDSLAVIDLVAPGDLTLGTMPLIDVINRRRSRRSFSNAALTLEELSFLLWTTQGVRDVTASNRTMRTVPSGGARHPFETYLAVNRVDGLEPGLYRYRATKHKLCLIRKGDIARQVHEGCMGQKSVKEAAVTFIWTATPHRTEWRYAAESHKIIAIDAGHVCQNLYLAAESIGCGTCAIGAYSQQKMDELVRVDGEDEFTIYAAPVGRLEE